MTPRSREAIWVGGVALALRFGVVAWAADRFPPVADGTFYHAIASRIAAGDGYTWLSAHGVRPAAHYPVGYPAAVGGLYALFGASPLLAMVLNALLGAAGAVAVHGLLAPLDRAVGSAGRPRFALVGGLAVAVHPGLVAYTPALMTEGVTASLLAIGAWLVSVARAARRGALAKTAWVGLVLGLASMVRPASVLLAPWFGALSSPRRGWRRAALGSLLATLVAGAVCLPWTARNCAVMGRCAFVSMNGGWNLLIGTDRAAGGTYAPLVAPATCSGARDEGEQDACYGRVALERIAAAPGAWLALVPDKLAATFDVCNVAGWYLETSNAGVFGHDARRILGAAEFGFERLFLLSALLAAWPRAGARRRPQRTVARVACVAGACFGLTPWAWPSFLLLLAAFGVGRGARVRAPAVVSTACAVVSALALTHAVFFGAGRYGLVVLPFVTAVGALGLCRATGWLRRRPRIGLQRP